MSSENSRYDYSESNYRGNFSNYPKPYRGHTSNVDPSEYVYQGETLNNSQQLHPDQSYRVGQNAPLPPQEEYSYGYAGRRPETLNEQSANPGIGVQSSFQQSFNQGRPFTGPLMTDVAMMYGSRFMDTGKEMVDKELNKYISIRRLKHYFTVDTAFTLKKLQLILFPYYNQTWAPKIVKGVVASPKEDVNAPDLYIPLMAYVTYVLLAGVVMGTKSKFSPEVLGVLASQALACVLIEIAVQMITIYISNLETRFCTWDLLALSGYKFVGIIVAVLLSVMFGRLGYYVGIIYCSISLALYLIRIMKWRMVNESVYNPGYRGDQSITGLYQGKRRLYLILSIALSQPLLMWWLSYNLDFNQNKPPS